MNMLRISAAIIGKEYSSVKNYQPRSKEKVKLFAGLVALMTILWFAMGYLMVTYILGGTEKVGLLVGTISAFMIFMIERTVILSDSGFQIATLRIVLGLCIAGIGSIVIDEIIFNDDIEKQLTGIRIDELNGNEKLIRSKYMAELNLAENEVKNSHEIWANSLMAAQKESDGTAGTGYRGVGNVARFKKSIADDQQIVFKQNEQNLANLQEKIDTEININKSTVSDSYESKGILLRVKALFQLVMNDIFVAIVYGLFTVLLLAFEFMIVFLKMFGKKTYDEELELEKENMLRTKVGKMKEVYEKHYNAAESLKKAAPIREEIMRPVQSILN